MQVTPVVQTSLGFFFSFDGDRLKRPGGSCNVLLYDTLYEVVNETKTSYFPMGSKWVTSITSFAKAAWFFYQFNFAINIHSEIHNTCFVVTIYTIALFDHCMYL